MEINQSEVCNLDLAKNLRDLGVKQTGEFCWIYSIEGRKNVWRVSHKDAPYSDYAIRDGAPCAFTVAELGAMFPNEVVYPVRNCVGKWQHAGYLPGQYFASEADARAKMYIYFIENGLLPVP
jgi:hypothetical protein